MRPYRIIKTLRKINISESCTIPSSLSYSTKGFTSSAGNGD
jgi:hypothetical protein